MQTVRNNKIDSITTRDQDLHGRKFGGAADGVKSQDYVTLSQLKSSVAAIPGQKPLPNDLAKIDVSQTFNGTQEFVAIDATKSSVIIDEIAAGQAVPVLLIKDKNGATIFSFFGFGGATPNLLQTAGSIAPDTDNADDLGFIAKFWKTIRGYVINAQTKFQANGVDGVTGSFTYVKTVDFITLTVTTGTVTVTGGIVTGIT